MHYLTWSKNECVFGCILINPTLFRFHVSTVVAATWADFAWLLKEVVKSDDPSVLS